MTTRNSTEMDPAPGFEPSENPPMDIFSRDDARALINLVPLSFQEAFLQAAQKRPDLMGVDERTLKKILHQECKTPTPTDNRLRLNFWREYDLAQQQNKKLLVDAIFANICHRSYFYNRYLSSAEKVAWMLCIPVSYENKMEEMLEYSVEQMRDIMSLPNEDASGKLNMKLLELKAKIFVLVDMRLKGGVVQRLEQKSLSLNVSTHDKSIARALTEGTMEDLEKKLKELEARERRALNLSDKAKGEIIVQAESE